MRKQLASHSRTLRRALFRVCKDLLWAFDCGCWTCLQHQLEAARPQVEELTIRNIAVGALLGQPVLALLLVSWSQKLLDIRDIIQLKSCYKF